MIKNFWLNTAFHQKIEIFISSPIMRMTLINQQLFQIYRDFLSSWPQLACVLPNGIRKSHNSYTKKASDD
jgi:hypothetical protein